MYLEDLALKKLLCVLIFLILLIPSALAENKPDRNAWLWEKTLQTGELLKNIIASDNALGFAYEASPRIRELESEIRAIDFSRPPSKRPNPLSQIKIIRLPEDIYKFSPSSEATDVLDEMASHGLLQWAIHEFYSNYFTTFYYSGIINSDDRMILENMTCETAYIQPDCLEEDTITWLDYGNYGLAVVFTIHNGAVIARAFVTQKMDWAKTNSRYFNSLLRIETDFRLNP